MIISVVIPFYKEIGLINRAVGSVFNQSLGDRAKVTFEVIIGNDGPYENDNVLDNIDARYRESTRVVKNTECHGPGGARNACLREAKGELVAFLDADDYWIPNKILLQLQRIEKGDTFVSTGYRFEDSPVCITPPSTIKERTDIFRHLGIGTSTVLITRSLSNHQFFRPLRFAQDIDYWYLLAGSDAFRYGAIDSPCVVYSRSGSTKNKFTQLRAFMRVLALNRVPLSARLPIVLRYSFRGLFNHFLRRK
jgi:teichuronic acid biosynthesis glycosyltransferase TuaG